MCRRHIAETLHKYRMYPLGKTTPKYAERIFVAGIGLESVSVRRLPSPQATSNGQRERRRRCIGVLAANRPPLEKATRKSFPMERACLRIVRERRMWRAPFPTPFHIQT